MNILTDQLPESVAVDGVEYPIHTDFRACLRIILACEDNDLTQQEKQVVLLANLYQTPPHDISGAIEQANWFLNGDKEDDDESGPRLFSFAKDASLIFAAFRQTHGIDLQSADLHWWTFLALFMDLGSDTTFCQLVALRKRVKTGKATKEEKRAAREMGSVFEIPEIDDRTLDEKERAEEFFRLAREAEQRRREQQTKPAA